MFTGQVRHSTLEAHMNTANTNMIMPMKQLIFSPIQEISSIESSDSFRFVTESQSKKVLTRKPTMKKRAPPNQTTKIQHPKATVELEKSLLLQSIFSARKENLILGSSLISPHCWKIYFWNGVKGITQFLKRKSHLTKNQPRTFISTLKHFILFKQPFLLLTNPKLIPLLPNSPWLRRRA